jgi:dTDP-4-dehydrorhamnose reductase
MFRETAQRLRPTRPLELWAGVECSVNRVGDRFFDQLEQSGHARRIRDLDRFAELGISALRYPVLWERTAPDGINRADWSWADERLARLRELKVAPIVGLVHHGSGPRSTSLLDPAFPEKLALYARAVAERYPWLTSYTPINEPLTTARFSGLYGHWFPHGRDDLTFARALLNQCRAVVLAMRAIREINPAAQLVQTEDLGKTFSTRALTYQAEFENERRWLSFDLLTGRLTRASLMWRYLRAVGIEEAELDWFAENSCPPNILGINHYLTSERFLDERLDRYPAHTRGGNGRDAYADVEAVRVCAEGPAGPRALMREAWERYHLPMAVTEAHLGCTREEQLRWLKEVWDGAQSLKAEGGDMRAVTVWSLLGSYDWNNLLTKSEGHYETGVFDLRSPRPRPTALARLMRELAAGRESEMPVLESPGWWRRLERLCYQPVTRRPHEVSNTIQGVSLKGGQTVRTVLITGATGTLGRAFARICELRGLSYRLLSRREMDIADGESVERVLSSYDAWAVVNTAGYVRVDDAEREAGKCLRENTTGPQNLAEACARHGVKLVSFSSDLVFDGRVETPYVESSGTAPLGVYGQSKAAAERAVLSALPDALMIRTSAFFGPWDQYNFVTVALRALASGERFTAAGDALVSPTYVPDLVHAALDLLIDDESGIWHLANTGAISWADFARRAATLAGLDASLVTARSTNSLNLPAPRPLYSVLASERGNLLPTLDDALARYLRECEIVWSGETKDKPAQRARAATSN